MARGMVEIESGSVPKPYLFMRESGRVSLGRILHNGDLGAVWKTERCGKTGMVLPFRGKEAKAYLHGGEGLLKDIGLRDRPIAAFERECTSVMYREDDGFLNGKGCV